MTDQEKEWNPREEWFDWLTRNSEDSHKRIKTLVESLLTAYEDRGKEIERLTECLKIANEQTEEYERRYYLKMNDIDKYMDENEALRAKIEDLEYKLNTAVATLYEKDEEIERLRAELSNVSQIGNGYRIGMELLSDEVTKLQKENEALRAELKEIKDDPLKYAFKNTHVHDVDEFYKEDED